MDCRATLEISTLHQVFKTEYLNDLYFPLNYQTPLLKKAIQKFKFQPFIRELAKPLALLIIEHFQLIDKSPDFSRHILIPIPLEKRKLKWRGFNQAQEIAKELSNFLKTPVFNGVLIKIKSTPPQVELPEKERKENIKDAFFCQGSGWVKDKKILLVDDIYTTGSTLEEAAKVLKIAGAKEIIGVVVARARPEEDKFPPVLGATLHK